MSVGLNACVVGSREETCCGAMTAAAVFGAFEWILLMTTMIMTITAVLNSVNAQKTPAIQAGAMPSSRWNAEDGLGIAQRQISD